MESEASQPKQERSRTRWTVALDKIFADLVVQQIQLGNRPNNVFDKKTWNHIRDEFNKQTDLNFNNNQLRKHLDVLRTRFNSLKSAYDQNEFSVMDEACCIGFGIWDDIGAPPRPEQVKVKDCPIYEQLCAIFTDSSADGKYAQSSHFEGLDKSVGNDAQGLSSCHDAGTGTALPDNPSNSKLAESTPSSEKPTRSVGDRKRKRPSEAQPAPNQTTKDGEIVDTMAGALLEMVAAWRSKTGATSTQADDRFSITNCIKALDEIGEADDSLYFAALNLFEDPNLRETFLSLKGNSLRLSWLQVKFGRSSSTTFF